jgi:serine/threonine protein kinase/predicted negative regulator of RcsB-dependent stress response
LINTRYEIIKKIGEGRSSVYLCKDAEFPGKEYAIKILPPTVNDAERTSFIKEYFVLKKLEHPFIIRPFGMGIVVHKDDEEFIEIGSQFITLEYFNGKELLSSEQIFPEENLKEIVKQICCVLFYLHQSKYIYYDLKPENILVSFNGGNPQIRLIDLGLAEYSPSTSEYEIKGTAHYIAPELLKKESHNHSVDFYSLGILLYRLLYRRFPVDSKNELDIYKSAIENEINFPPLENYSAEFIRIIKRLTAKYLAERYSSALAVIRDLGFPIDNSITKEFLPAKVFSSRSYPLNVLSKYISDKSGSEVFTVKGFDGVGKTSLLNRLMENHTAAILISEIKVKSGADLIRYILRKIIFSEPVFPVLSEDDKKSLVELMYKPDEVILQKLRSTMILLSSRSNFILLIDDFNIFDQLSINLLLEIIPFLQVNNIKVIISESTESDFISDKLNNVKEIVLGSFTDEEMIHFLNDSYSADFPLEELQKLILSYADLIPGNIKSFIKDLILFGIMKFSESGISFSDEEDKLSALKTTHLAIYDLRLANLSAAELFAAQVISAIDTYIDTKVLSSVLDISYEEVERIVENLQLHNIVQEYTAGQIIIFTSEAFKKHVYASILNKKELHLKIAVKLSEKVPQFNRIELARQYELVEEYEACFNVLMTEVELSEKHFAFEYIRRILVHLTELPLDKKMMNLVKIKLSEVCFKLGDVQAALTTIRELKKTLPPKEFSRNLQLIEGNSLIDTGEVEAGKEVISNLLAETDDAAEKQKLRVELAYADYELKKYDEAIKQCDALLGENNLTAELKGRCYNLKGIVDSYHYNHLESALDNFQLAKIEFNKVEQYVRLARVESNLGNIFSILKNYEEAENHWEKAFQINKSIGNLEQEGSLLNNFGEFYFSRTKYDLGVQSYLKALNIFLSLGNEMNRGLALKSLGEIYLITYDFQNSLNALLESYKIFNRLKKFEKTCEVLTFLGKLYFNIGSVTKLNESISSFEKILNKVELPPRYLTNLRYLIIHSYLLKDDKVSSDDIERIANEFKNLEEKNFMIECKFLLIKCLINEENYNEAYKQLIDNEFIVFCSQNSILEAEREYFLGILSKNYDSEKLSPPLVHFERAYELIRNEHITELTWKVLYEISELYLERGNFSKAKRFVIYTRELIYFIAERIESPRLRAAYLQQNERMNTLTKLENFYPQS